MSTPRARRPLDEPRSPRSLRVCTYNVHLWADSRGRSNVGPVVSLLRSLDLDVIALNEVPRTGGQLERVASEFGMRSAYGEASWLGNAILSRFPLEHVDTAEITESTEEARSALLVTVLTPAGPAEVCCTHLDPHFELTRTRELSRLRDAASRRHGAHLVMGDFNSLRLEDYTPAALGTVRAMRLAGDREDPRGEVIEAMDRAGYVDVWRLARSGDLGAYRSALAEPLPPSTLPTCWAGTRIDYVWATLPWLDAWSLEGVHRPASDASDHHPVVAEFLAREPSGG